MQLERLENFKALTNVKIAAIGDDRTP